MGSSHGQSFRNNWRGSAWNDANRGCKKFTDEISEIIVLDPTEGCPASQVGAKQIVGDFKDESAISRTCIKIRHFDI